MNEKVRLSASRVGTVKRCSWIYWSKYVNKIPDSSNTGASRGSVCHNIFEYLGKGRHKKHLEGILDKGSVSGSKAVSKLVKIQASQQDPPVDAEDELDMIDDFIVNGLRYDFYGEEGGDLFKAFSEQTFELKIEEGDKSYYIYGFIDKLFLYDKGKKAVVRDFKTSKKVYSGSEITDNLQNLMYCLAVKKLYPDCEEIQTEFLFLKFDLSPDMLGSDGEGVIKMGVMSNEELEGFEHHLTEIQSYLDNFDENCATSNFAADQPYATDGTFSGPLSCGFAKYPGQLKKDGTIMWHCNYKFPFDYWALKDSDGKIIKSVKDGEEFKLIPNESSGEYMEKLHYEGCPKYNAGSDDGLDLD
jgi:hypothetical protein